MNYYQMSNMSKNVLLNYYKSKINKKYNENSFYNQLLQKYPGLNSSRKESSKEKNRFNSKKNKTTKNSPNSSLIINIKDFSIEKNKGVFKDKDSFNKSKEIFKDSFVKKINLLEKGDKGNISKRQNVSKNIFNMYNSIRNGSGLINNRLVKNRKTANLISNLNINNLNNEKINDDNKIYKKDINNSKNELNYTNNKSLFSNYKQFFNEKNTSFKNRLYNFNITNKNPSIVNFKKINNKEIKKNTINNSFLKRYIIQTNKGKDNSMKIENSFNTKIRKISSIDYLYNNKKKKTERKHHISYINENRSDFNIAEKRNENKIGEIESSNMNLSNRNININKFINKNVYNKIIDKKERNKNIINKIKIKNNKERKKNNIYDIKLSELANNSALISENYFIKSIQYISNNNNCNNINNQNISINININNNEKKNNFINNESSRDNQNKKENIFPKNKENVNVKENEEINKEKRDENNINNNKYKKYSKKLSEDNINNKINNKDEINEDLNENNKYKNPDKINKIKKLGISLKTNNFEEKLNAFNNNEYSNYILADKEKEKENKKIKSKINNINEKRDFSPIYEENLNVKEHISKLNQFCINKNNVSNILLKRKIDNKNNISFNDNFIKNINNKIYLEDNNQNGKKNSHILFLGKYQKDDDDNKMNKKDSKNYKLIDLKEFQSSKNAINDIKNLDNNKGNIDDIILDSKLNNRNKYKAQKNKKELDDKNDMIYIPDSCLNKKEKSEKELTILTISKDSYYFKEKLDELALYIKNYYKKNQKYPKSNIDFYLYGREIGCGAFGKVKLSLHIGSGRLVAIKIFSIKKLNERKKKKIRNEINILSKLRHKFINQILDTFSTDKYIFIVMEYICADLLSFIRKREKLSENISKSIFKQIIEGLKYINKKKIVHRDIKLDNILIDLNNTVKICDFGVSKKISEDELMIDHCGTPGYIAPEIYKNKGYEGFQCDIWSAGVTLYYMLSGTQPFRAYSLKEMEKKVVKGEFEEIKNISAEANDLIKKMLQIDPDKRIRINEILNHPWLKDEDVENRKNLKLFTENEKILLSKYDVNYLSSNKEELIENFTLKNLETINEDEKLKDIGHTKSIIFSPFNSYIEEKNNNNENTNELKRIYEEIKMENNICKYAAEAQQENIRYELSNNNEFDNGMIKTQKEEDINKHNEEIKKIINEEKNEKINGIHSSKFRSVNNSFETDEDIIDENIIKTIENNLGYDFQHIINSIKKNKINYATATYYLLKKEKNSDII